jgi:hypothetical protein
MQRGKTFAVLSWQRLKALAFPAADNHEHNPADQTVPPSTGEKGMVFFVGAQLQRPGIDYFFARRVGESAVGKRENPTTMK